MNTAGIIATVHEQYRNFKQEMLQKGAAEIWSMSGEVTAWRYIKDFLEGIADDGEDLLQRLYERAGDAILSTLVSEYMKHEGYDVGSWDGIRSLALDYLEFSEY